MKFVAVFFVVSMVASGYAAEYPAGLFPALCPDYPNCDNALLARYYADGQPKPEWELPHIAPVPLPQAPLAKEWPAGVSPAACPNYPYCNTAVSADPLPGFAARLYPAGVAPAACPGYPFC